MEPAPSGERSPSQHRRLWQSLRLGGAVAAVMLCGTAVVAHAQASPQTRSTAGARAAKTTGPPPPVLIPTTGPSILSPFHSYGQYAVGKALTENLAGKAQTVITLPVVPVELIAVDSFSREGYQNSPAWVISNARTPYNPVTPTAISYGQFPAVTVHTLAFGAIPLVATIHLSQLVVNGGYEPLLAQQKNPPVGDEVDPYGFTLSGQLNLSVSDVSVDGVPLQLSASCRTVTPAQLIAHANGIAGDPDFYNPIVGGSFAGNVVVPGFTGCTARPNGGVVQDLDALFDGTVSGSANAAFISQNRVGQYYPTREYACYPNTTDPAITTCDEPPSVPAITTSITAAPPSPPGIYAPPTVPTDYPAGSH